MTIDDKLALQAKEVVLEAAIAQGTFTLMTVLEYIHTGFGGVLDDKYCLDETKPSVAGGQAIVAFGTHLWTNEPVAFKFFQLQEVFEQEAAVYQKLVRPRSLFDSDQTVLVTCDTGNP